MVYVVQGRGAERDNDIRLRTFERVDNSGFTRHHWKVAIVSGVGFFTDAYDIFAIEIVAAILGYIYGPGNGPNFSHNMLSPKTQELAIKIAAPCGMFVGQLVFGWLGDMLGRKRTYGVELMIMIIATFGQTVTAPSYGVSIIGTLIVWRFILGLGIGGDYPLSAVIASEFASVENRGRMMTAVFANQGIGQLVAAIVAIVCVYGWKSSILGSCTSGHCSPVTCTTYPCTIPPLPHPAVEDLDRMWRLILGFGCVPGVIALYFRLTIPETPRFTMDVLRNVQQAEMDADNFLSTGTYFVDPDAPIIRANARVSSVDDFLSYFSKRKNWMVLFGTAYSWFALDIAFYGLGLNSPRILTAMDMGSVVTNVTISNTTQGTNSSTTLALDAVVQSLEHLTVGNMILTAAGYLPGFIVAFWFIDKWGRRNIQIMGFAVLTVLFFILGGVYRHVFNSSGKTGQRAYVFLYVLANFFQNFGPNTTTFIVPGEVFPTRYRSTAHGISAACGKLGAIISQVIFTFVADKDGDAVDLWVGWILLIYACVMLSGAVVSYFFIPETLGKTLEQLSNESQVDFIRPSASKGSLAMPTQNDPNVQIGYNLPTLQAATHRAGESSKDWGDQDHEMSELMRSASAAGHSASSDSVRPLR